MEYLVHSAFALIAMSFAVRDILWLRCISIAASFIMVVYALFDLEHYLAILIWNTIFISINGIQIGVALYGERTARFSPIERELYARVFSSFSKLEFVKLLRHGRWEEAPAGTVLTREGQDIEFLLLIARGRVAVEVAGRAVAELGPGQFIGEMSFITGDKASATVTTTTPAEYLSWSKPALIQLLMRNPSMRLGLEAIFGADLSRKLRKVSSEATESDQSGARS